MNSPILKTKDIIPFNTNNEKVLFTGNVSVSVKLEFALESGFWNLKQFFTLVLNTFWLNIVVVMMVDADWWT